VRAHTVGVDNRRDGDGARREGRALLDIARRGWDEAGAVRWNARGRLGGTPGVDTDHRWFGERRGAVTIGEPAGAAAETKDAAVADDARGVTVGAVAEDKCIGGSPQAPPRWTRTQEGSPRAQPREDYPRVPPREVDSRASWRRAQMVSREGNRARVGQGRGL
jgi:hypothetical protein